ncbi:MAG: hypothetical protein HKP61_17195 [Dactylosporangium sp.]|nr:hypothetical protein [Dactylosporangium sp.]NNJ62642.1 hypothetical protein [Dactylosporangium sp.]
MAPARAEPVSGRKLDADQSGRPAPCPQQQSLAATRARYEGTLALLDQTQALPVLAPASPQRRGPWQWLTALVREAL